MSFKFRAAPVECELKRPVRKEWQIIYDGFSDPPFSKNGVVKSKLMEVLDCEAQEIGPILQKIARALYSPWERKIPEVIYRLLSGEIDLKHYR